MDDPENPGKDDVVGDKSANAGVLGGVGGAVAGHMLGATHSNSIGSMAGGMLGGAIGDKRQHATAGYNNYNKLKFNP